MKRDKDADPDLREAPLWEKVRDLEELEQRHERTLQLLQESEELYRAVVENVADAIAITVGTDRVFVNKAFLDIHGLKDVSEVLGLPIDQFILSDDREGVRKRALDRREGRSVEQQINEYRIMRRDGQVRWVQAHAVTINYKGEPAMLAVLRDITELKQAEEEILSLNRELEQRVKELRESNQELEAFNYMVSHDLKTPLIAIEGFSKRIVRECPLGSDPKCASHLEIIRKSAQQMAGLIEDLLAYCRLGKEEVGRSKIDMAGLTGAVVDELKLIQGNREIEVHVASLPDAWGDAPMIRQVLMNLLSNAFKFTGVREKAVIEIGGMETGKENTYFVKDNGPGFEAERAGGLFGLFRRLHAPGEFEGTGVGLAVVKRIVEGHGGQVWAEGDVGKGATFYFTLPSGDDRGSNP